ncbi:MAG: AMP-binding protein [Acidimicrobiaceae bacterium]|nr:AMP-binding protein [Acidimicrobiaceae bacterium]
MRGDPDKTALICGDVSLTFRALGDRSAAMAASLAERGLARGDRLAAMLPNGLAFFEVGLGAASLGCPVVPVNWHLKRDELEWVLRDADVRLLVAHRDFADTAGACVAGVPTCRLLLVSDDVPDTVPAARFDFAVPNYLYFTSGTTGRPRAVVRQTPPPQGAALDGLAAMWGFTGDDVYLACSPLYHAANGYAFTTLFQGGTVIVLPRWDAREWLRAVERHRVTACFMVPAYFIRLLEIPDQEWARFDLSSLRLILHAAAPCPIPVKRQILDRLHAVDIWEFYGATEGGVTRISAADWRNHPGSVGTPWPGVEIRILDDAGDQVGPGQTGRIFVRPPGGQRFSYHNDPVKTEGAWVDDSFTVGDVGHVDEDGFLYITDRASDMVLRGGVNIYPAEIEAVFQQHPDVVDCTVFGVPDDRMGEELQALVEIRHPVNIEDLRQYCRDRLADFKVPRYIDIVDALPRDPLGKVQKRRLRDQRWAGRRMAV